MKHDFFLTVVAWVLLFAAIIATVLSAAQIALAHDGETTFQECHDTYWVCRRELIADDISLGYGVCVGAAMLADVLTKNPTPYQVAPNILDYYKGIPAHPVEDNKDDIPFCMSEILACVVNRGTVLANVGLCWAHVNAQLAKIKEVKLVKPKKAKRR